MNAVSTTACAEQLWNECQLEQPVRAPAWRLWRYDAPAIVLGCSQRRLLAEVGDATALPVLLRGSGGGAVLVGPWMLGLSVALPPEHPLVQGGLLASYRWLGEALAGVLQDFGLPAQALAPAALREAEAAQAAAPVDWACFGSLSPWELTAGGRKLIGLAQVRRRHGVLLVGGLLLDAPDWPLLCRVLGRPGEDAARLARRTVSWAQLAGGPTPPAALAVAIDRALGAALAAAQVHEEELPPRRRPSACVAA